MEYFNIFGLVFISLMLILNIIFAFKCKDGFKNNWNNRSVEIIEQIGRFGCMFFMVINIPHTYFGWFSDEIFSIYIIVNTILVILYFAFWIICYKQNSIFRALVLSIIPSIIFLFSGALSRSIPLIISALLFAPTHILISYKNAKLIKISL